ncbi:MAG: thiamine pyrophosphate-binding protein [Alphaproteobacteria bacterium]|nr:thiamine pyrophosphate-binding protein [Alphaproteobacteria bacterium]
MPDLTKFDRPVNVGNPKMGWASDVAAEMLRRMGIKYLSMNPGASYRGFHDSIVNYLGNDDPQMILCLHEDHAVHIAQGYAKATDEPMGCILHSNVGLMHGMMGIFNAWCNRVPMVIMGATGPVDTMKRRPWIDWIHTAKDQGALIRNFVKYDDEPRSAQALAETMVRVNKTIRTAPTAPAYVCLDAGLQESEIDPEMKLPDVSRFLPPPPTPAPQQSIDEAADLLANAKNPVIMMGRLKRDEKGWANRIKLAELLGAGVATDMKTGASFPTDHALHLAPPSNRPRQEAESEVKNADVILDLNWVDLAGTFKLIFGRDDVNAKVIHVSMDSIIHNGWTTDHMGMPLGDVTMLAEPEPVVEQLLEALEKRLGGKSKWDGENKGRTADPDTTYDMLNQDDNISVEAVTLCMNEVRKGRNITLTNVTIGWAADGYHFTHPLDYLGNDGGGGLASGTGTGIGAGLALADTDRTVVAVLGDGDTMQGASSLWTAAHYSIPVLFVISNNRSNFNDEIHQETVAKTRNRPVENRWIGQRIDDPTVSIERYAASLGVESAGPIEKVADLVPALEKALSVVEAGKPYLLNVHVEKGYAVPPPAREA